MKESFRVSRILQCQKALILFMHTYRWEFTHQPETLKKCKSDYMPSWLQIVKWAFQHTENKIQTSYLGVSGLHSLCAWSAGEFSIFLQQTDLVPLSFCTACFLSEILTICLKHSFSPWALLAGLNPFWSAASAQKWWCFISAWLAGAIPLNTAILSP